MSQQQYTELATIITNKCDQNGQSTPEGTNSVQYTAMSLQQPLGSQHHTLSQEQVDNAMQTVPSAEVDEILQDGRALIETFLKQPETKMQSIVNALQLKKSVGKSFTEFLLYIIKLFLKAVEDKTITMTRSTRQSVVSELNLIKIVLIYVRKEFCSSEGGAPADDSVAIVVGCAVQVTDVIRSLQKKQWLRWFRSAKNISALVPIFERITEVVRDVQCIECREFSKLLGDVEALQDSLVDIEKRLLVVQGAGLSASVLVGIGSIVCMIVGGILLATPAGLPLLAVGGAGVGVSIATGGGTALCSYIATKRLYRAKLKGDTKGDILVEKDSAGLVQ